MKEIILLFLLVTPLTVFAGDEVVLDIRDEMTMREFTEAGLDKLSSDEMDALNKWLSHFTEGKASGKGNAVETQVKEKVKKEKSGILGSFSSPKYKVYRVQKVSSGYDFKINNNNFMPTGICPGYSEGDEVIFTEGRADGMCESAEFSRPDGSDVCEVFCR